MKQRVAILFQALKPPVINGQRKAPKPGGYADSGADIGFCLKNGGIDVVTPSSSPDATIPKDWVFPDTAEGIEAALGKGANVLWANTILFSGHPLERVMHQVGIVGQLPSMVQKYDDKFLTNRMLYESGLPIARSYLLGNSEGAEISLDGLDNGVLAKHGLHFPIVVKPVRGRGSQGVVCTHSLADLKSHSAELLGSGEYGSLLIVEEYLSGEELTVTVMPPVDGSGFRALRPVVRFNHSNGIAPYNGTVAVTANSRAITTEELKQDSIHSMLKACVETAAQIEARAPIRIDCRADRDGVYRLFDINVKPNMTGAGRPGREDQDSLSAIAARAEGWSYLDLLKAMLASAWRS